jgi:hypothetical protein
LNGGKDQQADDSDDLMCGSSKLQH